MRGSFGMGLVTPECSGVVKLTMAQVIVNNTERLSIPSAGQITGTKVPTSVLRSVQPGCEMSAISASGSQVCNASKILGVRL